MWRFKTWSEETNMASITCTSEAKYNMRKRVREVWANANTVGGNLGIGWEKCEFSSQNFSWFFFLYVGVLSRRLHQERRVFAKRQTLYTGNSEAFWKNTFCSVKEISRCWICSAVSIQKELLYCAGGELILRKLPRTELKFIAHGRWSDSIVIAKSKLVPSIWTEPH